MPLNDNDFMKFDPQMISRLENDDLLSVVQLAPEWFIIGAGGEDVTSFL